MRVLFVTSEIATLYKRGGLADVSYALPVALSKLGVHVSVAMPFYEKVPTKGAVCVGQLAIDFDRRRELVFVFRAVLPHSHVRVFLFRHPMLHDYDDLRIADRFAFYSKCVAQMALYSQETLGGPYDIIHCNDWHTALIPLLIGENRKAGYRERETIQAIKSKTILTIHNLLYRGETGISIALKLGFPKSVFHVFATKLGPAVRLLEEGMEYSDRVTTVSPTYAREIMQGIHSKRALDIMTRRNDSIIGILNGIDTQLWDPATDPALPVRYTGKTMHEAKVTIKSALRKAVRLPEEDVPVFGFVGRLEVRQKGLDLIAKAIGHLDPSSYQLVILGTGQNALVTAFTRLAEQYKNIAFIPTFDERLARRIYAGSDFMLVPSKFEPCGLTQLIAMRYGTIPIVRRTGGLADTVTDGETGFVFGPYTTSALVAAMRRAVEMFRASPEIVRRMQRRVFRQDFSWKRQAAAYLSLYRNLL